MCNDDKVIKTRPVRPDEHFMLERFSEAIAGQSMLTTTLAQQLLIVELAVPGFYAAILKLVSGVDKIELSVQLMLAFGCWLAAVVCTVAAMFPRQYKDVQRHSPDSIELFFDRAAAYKRRWLFISVCAFVLGVFFSVWDLFK